MGAPHKAPAEALSERIFIPKKLPRKRLINDRHVPRSLRVLFGDAASSLETRAPDDLRELLVYMFYPSDAEWRDELTERLKRMRAHSTVRLLDPRFRGGVNIDGNEKGTGFEWVSGRDSGKQPFMWIEGPYQHPTERDFQQAGITEEQWKDMYADGDRQMRSVQGGALRATIARIGIDYMDFSDNPFWDVSAAPAVRAGKLRTMDITRKYVLAFFDGCLRGQWSGLRRLVTEAGKAYPEISARKFGALLEQ